MVMVLAGQAYRECSAGFLGRLHIDGAIVGFDYGLSYIKTETEAFCAL